MIFFSEAMGNFEPFLLPGVGSISEKPSSLPALPTERSVNWLPKSILSRSSPPLFIDSKR